MLIRHSVDAAHRMEALLKGCSDFTQAADAAADNTSPADANELVRKTLATFEEQIRETGAVIECGPLPSLADSRRSPHAAVPEPDQ